MTDDETLVITEEKAGGICRFILKGRIDSSNSDKLQFTLDNAVKEGEAAITLNMTQVDYLSSMGIRVILKIYKQMSETKGKFNIERPSRIVKNLLGMVALKEMLID